MAYLIAVFAIIVIWLDVFKTRMNRDYEEKYIRTIEDKNKELLREMIYAIKSKNIDEYALSNIDNTELPPQEDRDELMDIADVDPEKLLEAIRQKQ